MGKSSKKRHPKAILTPIGEYIEVQPALHMIRIMNRFFGEVVDCPAFSPFMQELRVGYMEILNEELSSYALDLALAIVELEVAYPEIQTGSGSV
jgi:hypothetical protein